MPSWPGASRARRTGRPRAPSRGSSADREEGAIGSKLPRLILITDFALPARELYARLKAALALGPAVAVQLRHPGAAGRALLEEAEALQGLCQGAGNPLFVSARLDVALGVGAHLHLPSWALTPTAVRDHLPKDRWISVAVHDRAEAERAEGATLALVSPVFAPTSKPGDGRPPLTPRGFLGLARRLPCPAYALGGVTPLNAAEVAGAVGVAAIGSVLHAKDPAEAAARILSVL